MIELARKHNILVVTDDVYNLIYHDKPPDRLYSFDNKLVTLCTEYNVPSTASTGCRLRIFF